MSAVGFKSGCQVRWLEGYCRAAREADDEPIGSREGAPPTVMSGRAKTPLFSRRLMT